MIVTVLIALLCSIVSFVGGFCFASVSLNKAWVKNVEALNLYWAGQMKMVVATFLREQGEDVEEKESNGHN